MQDRPHTFREAEDRHAILKIGLGEGGVGGQRVGEGGDVGEPERQAFRGKRAGELAAQRARGTGEQDGLRGHGLRLHQSAKRGTGTPATGAAIANTAPSSGCAPTASAPRGWRRLVQ